MKGLEFFCHLALVIRYSRLDACRDWATRRAERRDFFFPNSELGYSRLDACRDCPTRRRKGGPPRISLPKARRRKASAMKKKLSPHPITNAKKQAKTVEESKTEADSAAATSRPMVEPAQLKEFQKDFEIARLSSDAAKYYLRAETNHVA